MSQTKVAIVTGSNQGIGFETVKNLCQKFPGVVYLTSRDVRRGREAIESLNKVINKKTFFYLEDMVSNISGINRFRFRDHEAAICQLSLKPEFHQLDVLDKRSIEIFAQYIKEKYGGIDILVNNAAIAYQVDSPEPFGEQAEVCLATNYFGLVSVCDQLFPLLRPHARVVNLSSCEGHLSKIPGQAVRDRLRDPNLTLSQLTDLVNEFIQSAKAGTYLETGWGRSSYRVSKNAVCALTFLQQRQLDQDPRPDIIVNAVHPGFCSTNMTRYRAPLTSEQGALAPTYLALLPPDVKEPRGQFVWKDCSIISWEEPLKERF